MTIKDFFWTFGKYDLDDYINAGKNDIDKDGNKKEKLKYVTSILRKL